MSPLDFGLGVFASWLANKIGEKPKPSESPKQMLHETATDVEKVNVSEPKERIRRFKEYDIYRDLEEILQYVEKPVAHIIVENSPSSFYNLAALVIEDKETGIWFVFGRGRMAFQGTGGGAQQTERAVGIFKEMEISVAPWSVPKELLDEFESGFILWPEIKNELVPLVSSIESTEKWEWIQEQAKETLYKVRMQV